MAAYRVVPGTVRVSVGADGVCLQMRLKPDVDKGEPDIIIAEAPDAIVCIKTKSCEASFKTAVRQKMNEKYVGKPAWCKLVDEAGCSSDALLDRFVDGLLGNYRAKKTPGARVAPLKYPETLDEFIRVNKLDEFMRLNTQAPPAPLAMGDKADEPEPKKRKVEDVPIAPAPLFANVSAMLAELVSRKNELEKENKKLWAQLKDQEAKEAKEAKELWWWNSFSQDTHATEAPEETPAPVRGDHHLQR